LKEAGVSLGISDSLQMSYLFRYLLRSNKSYLLWAEMNMQKELFINHHLEINGFYRNITEGESSDSTLREPIQRPFQHDKNSLDR
jgi:hypothetical protein